jgi:hypothetical protein
VVLAQAQKESPVCSWVHFSLPGATCCAVSLPIMNSLFCDLHYVSGAHYSPMDEKAPGRALLGKGIRSQKTCPRFVPDRCRSAPYPPRPGSCPVHAPRPLAVGRRAGQRQVEELVAAGSRAGAFRLEVITARSNLGGVGVQVLSQARIHPYCRCVRRSGPARCRPQSAPGPGAGRFSSHRSR